MTRLPRALSGKRCIKGLERLGFTVDRQVCSHVILVAQGPFRTVSVPLHAQLRPGTLVGILKQARVSKAAFVRALKKRRP